MDKIDFRRPEVLLQKADLRFSAIAVFFFVVGTHEYSRKTNSFSFKESQHFLLHKIVVLLRITRGSEVVLIRNNDEFVFR